MTIDEIATASGAVLVGLTAVRLAVAARSYLNVRRENQRKHLSDVATLKNQLEGGSTFQPVQENNAAPEPGPAWEGTRPFRIVRRIPENADGSICSFYLQPVDGQPIPAYRPGQFLSFSLPIGGNGTMVHRCYSLSAPPTGPQVYYRVSIKRSQTPGHPPGVGSSFFHDRLPEGAVVEVRAPGGSFYVDQNSDRPVVLIAGGVGITPLFSMMSAIVGTNSRRDVWLFYGVQNRHDHAFRSQIAELCSKRPNVNCVMFYSRPTQACRRGVDYVCEGYVDVAVMQALLSARNYEFYMCGPPPMMDKVRAELTEWGVPESEIHTEAFGSAVKPPAGPIPNAAQTSSEVFKVEFAKSRKSVTWSKENGSVLELAELSGIAAKCACRVGQCGTCKLRLKSGNVKYQSDPANPVEAGSFLPCIAQPTSDLVVDL